MSAISTEQLSKRYGNTLALESLDLTVEPGEVYGYLGPNGAGKTTTIWLLLGLHRPSGGRAELFGLDAWRKAVDAHRRVAYVAGEPFLWPSLTAEETLAYLARLHGSTDAAYRDRLVERFQLELRLLLAAVGAVPLALTAALLGWVGAASQNAGVSLPRMLEAGGNCLPTAFFFLGLGAVAFALVPRASIGIAYGLVSIAFVWELFGALLGAPDWLLDLTPFQHVALVPSQPFRTGAALALLAISAAAALAALQLFNRRDLATA